ncbi:MAG: Plasmid stabilization system [Candidatus Roizmanbacteria bacterium GW2011_GWC2_37_13]|uniref:Plasmid stabilization system n=1 Tax=Candidatus Roizmanbacteria bacterium GW2011_GWC2_37_13 TaxID=1618486 RepID=A0A0G0JBH9_9BACT|nr:MAG: Plasmid stabilization system [Candidatus Roizmanbacteria bacterium GW2011_GWC1_37_12]KKQ25546.1 MAG: Plasmid stabilization system [Candidatus Roizmanbacteria bacterium GW2011_GWC2_37_13]
MKIYYSSKFEKEYRRLPIKIKLLAEKKEKIFRENPFDSQLKIHKLKGKLSEFYAFSIDIHYRIIFEFADTNIVWFHSVGTHAIYR